MGMILEHQGNEAKALRFYHASLRYALFHKNVNNDNGREKTSSSPMGRNGSSIEEVDDGAVGSGDAGRKRTTSGPCCAGMPPAVDALAWLGDVEASDIAGPLDLMEVRIVKSSTAGRTRRGMTAAACGNDDDCIAEDGEMELLLERKFDQWTLSSKGEADVKATDGDDGSTKFFYDEIFPSNPPAMVDGGHFERKSRGTYGKSPTSISP